MAKTCRTCGTDRIWGRCDIGFAGINRLCWTPRETPLLVDELADALDGIMGVLTGHWFSYSRLGRNAETVAQKLTGQAEAALARYKEEVGDANV